MSTMKNYANYYRLLLAVMVIMTISFTSCKDDDDPTPDPTPITAELQGDITSNMTVEGQVGLVGQVHVKAGAVLTIKEGTIITADPNELSYLLIEQGAQIIAEGTAAAPIVLTSSLQEAGAWGGIHICGKAPINSGATGLSEIGDAVYGGTDASDNSGILKYVRVEYSGTALDDEHEANGISFYGVGNGTTVDYVEIYIGADDGIEFFGGTANIKHTKVYGCKDDCFDWTEGWSGNAQYIMAVQTEEGDRGIEGDNLESNHAATPMAMPKMSQVTLIGKGNAENYGMKLRRGTAGTFMNMIVTGFDKRSIHCENSQTLRNINDETLDIDFSYINNAVSDLAIKYSEDETDPVAVTKAFELSENLHLVNLTEGVDGSTTYENGFDMSTIDQFFESDTQIGSGNEWAYGWTKGDDGSVDPALPRYTSLDGDITESGYVEGEVNLTGPVHVKNGAKLYFRAGSIVTANADELSYLLIEQGAQIFVEGTASAPVIFTSNLEEAGAWGGLHLCGKAPINSGSTGLSEIGDALYGGTDANDNSGTINYLRVEYSGTSLDDEHEANGISMYGVGAGTVIDYVDIFIGADDGIEFFGGTCNIKHARVYACKDDSFDWTEGWSGKAQYILLVQGESGDRGIEGDNLESDHTASPMAQPMFSHLTMIGAGDAENYGMKLRRGTGGTFMNIIIGGNFDKRTIHVENSQTLRNVNNELLDIDFAYLNNVVSDVAIKYSADESDPVEVTKAFELSENVHLEDLTGFNDPSTTYEGGMDMSTVDSFFDNNTKIGSGNDWTQGWIKE